MPESPTLADAPAWTAEDAEKTYFVQDWAGDYFFVNEAGHVAARPAWKSEVAIDLFQVVEALRARGVQLPVLIRLQDLLQARVIRINESFKAAIAATGYEASYQGVFPIKVNQLREVVEELLEAGRPYNYGLECGSKAEMIACMPYLETDRMLLIWNGCKDAESMRLALAGQKLGQNILPVIERVEDVDLLMHHARDLEVEGQFGVRIRLSTSGAGLWSESGGENSKFGISLTELLALVDRLREREHPPAFRLLHFHLGSQIADLRNVRDAVEEAARIYARLYKRGLPVRYLDIGGGLGVSYEAGNPDVAGSINYVLDDYTRAVVEALGRICTEEGVPHPTLVSESGRAVTAFHSVLVLETLGAREKDHVEHYPAGDASHPVLQELEGVLADVRRDGDENLRASAEAHELAESLRARVLVLFRQGKLTLEEKAYAERLYWTACAAINAGVRAGDAHLVPETLYGLDPQLRDQYLCNFSVFRSMVDYWAIGQRFPIMPLHRLLEEPTRRGTISDLTCDSDGQVTDFVAPEGDKRFIELHPLLPGQPYFLGCFLMGAYQDIMGDMHNLFGRVTEAHVYVDEEEPNNFYIEKILQGATVEEQLALVQYFPNDLERRMSDLIQQKVKSGHIRPPEGVLLLEQYKSIFSRPTYLRTDGY